MHISNHLLRHLDPVTLRLLLRVSQEGTLTHAARCEAIAVSAASKRLLDLEHVLGTSLFRRKPRGMELTAAGYIVLDHVQEIICGAQKVRAELAKHAERERDIVRVAANLSAIVEFLPDDMGEFVSKRPDIKIELEELSSDAVVQAVKSGDADIGICMHECAEPQLRSHLYRRDRLVLVTRQAHPFAKHARILLSYGRTWVTTV